MFRYHDRQSIVASIGLMLFALSVLTTMIGCVWMIVAAIINATRR